MIKILAWLLVIVFSPWLLIIAIVIWFLSSLSKIFSEVIRIIDYEIQPYIFWKIKNVRERFRKKDSN